MKNIPKPTKEIVKKYLKKWNSLDNYTAQESSLKKLFMKTYPHNNDIDNVLIKVCSLNDFYSTNIFSPFTVAKHIVKLNIDKALSNNDLKIVNKIAKTEMKGKKIKNFYSFATKYCSHHKPKIYPIYDSYVEKVLLHFKRTRNFFSFRKQDLKLFPNYVNTLIQFRIFFGLEKFDLKEIDRYLWLVGKEYFKKNYSLNKNLGKR